MKWTILTFLGFLTLLPTDSGGQVQNTLVGIATDGYRNRLIGINVMIKGTITGRVTNVCGEFSIPVDSEIFTLVFHGMSYDDLRTYEIEMTKKDVTKDTVVFQLGRHKAPNPSCDKVDKKAIRKVIE